MSARAPDINQNMELATIMHGSYSKNKTAF